MRTIAKAVAVWLSSGSLVFVTACGSSDAPEKSAASTGQVSADAGGADAPTPSADSGTSSALTCSLREVSGAEPVTAEFVNLAPPTVVAPTMSGGATNGRFRVTRARVYTPKETSAFVDPTRSTGTIKSWIVFEGNEYRLRTEIDVSIATNVAGSQVVKETTDYQGTYTVSGPNLLLTGSPCAGTSPSTSPDVGYSFTNAGGSLTLLIKTKAGPTNSDSYTELNAVLE